jgi:FixJ family two-component response regulator
VTDVVMPEMNGRDLARRLLSLCPGLKRLFISGYTADVIAHEGVLEDGVHFLQKPFSMKELATKVRGCWTRDNTSWRRCSLPLRTAVAQEPLNGRSRREVSRPSG